MATVLTIRVEFKVDGTLTDPTALTLSDSTGTYGIRKTGGDNVIAAATDISGGKISTGIYEYEFTEANGAVYEQAYTSWVHATYDSLDYYFDEDHEAVSEPGAAVLSSYSSLLKRVGHFLFGIRSSFSSDQTDDITDCIRDGLRRVYASHDWSFFKPVEDISTTAPYTTGTVTVVDGVVTLATGTWPSWADYGILKVSNSYYSIDTRDSDSQLTLDDTTLDVDAGTSYELGRPEIPLASTFEAVANDSDLTYYPDQNELYPAVSQRHDAAIRKWQMDDPYYDRPVHYSVRTVEFDPTTGSRRRLAFYPVPDAAYVLRVPMILRATMLDSTNQYPVGGESLSQLILEACLAAAEHNYDDTESVHEKRYLEMLPLSIRTDQERSSPTSLGGDAPRGGRRTISDYWLRSARMGAVTLDGDTM
jgi:hypothetical protein